MNPFPYPNDPADPASPAHYPDAATLAEQLMRADFARMHQLRAAAPHAETLEAAEQLLDQAAEIRRAWLLTDGQPFSDFQYLIDAVAAWTRNPAAMRRHLTADNDPAILLPIHRRSHHQAAELTGHTDITPADQPAAAAPTFTAHTHGGQQ
ncbi:hypothetical protein [Nocardia sp. alder85J]|uniref:hypothetical protein n=1 Tax=Nocardia sp. alder85J TaxID=2862949 RepID=UPI001CD6FDCF|nr:hypothetical protein [Nocardia sp. alder85J]MCX4099099.1 hypothetical protein [Nocardia sp. alder85J]